VLGSTQWEELCLEGNRQGRVQGAEPSEPRPQGLTGASQARGEVRRAAEDNQDRRGWAGVLSEGRLELWLERKQARSGHTRPLEWGEAKLPQAACSKALAFRWQRPD
jgi:hypothetical protein